MQEIDLNKASWTALFEPFNFFEAYTKYLVVDIVADNDDDLLLWKGWVESRLRQLTLKVSLILELHRSSALILTRNFLFLTTVALL
jgi:poly(A) polymerase Pap1